MWIHLKNREPFAFPDLWDSWLDRDSGNDLYSFTIITTRANPLVRRIHDRMPVIDDAAMGRQWLEGPFGARAMALDLCCNRSHRSERQLTKSRRSSIHPENDSAECIQAVSVSDNVKRRLPLL
jgi:putative SOS response-associated peptidase YedK